MMLDALRWWHGGICPPYKIELIQNTSQGAEICEEPPMSAPCGKTHDDDNGMMMMVVMVMVIIMFFFSTPNHSAIVC